MTAIRKHLVDFIAIIALVVVALVVASVILANQRLALPGWVPGLGQDFTEVEAELASAQAVTPGQGQTVNVAGVEVGEISAVRLDGFVVCFAMDDQMSTGFSAAVSALIPPSSALFSWLVPTVMRILSDSPGLSKYRTRMPCCLSPR